MFNVHYSTFTLHLGALLVPDLLEKWEQNSLLGVGCPVKNEPQITRIRVIRG